MSIAKFDGSEKNLIGVRFRINECGVEITEGRVCKKNGTRRTPKGGDTAGGGSLARRQRGGACRVSERGLAFGPFV